MIIKEIQTHLDNIPKLIWTRFIKRIILYELYIPKGKLIEIYVLLFDICKKCCLSNLYCPSYKLIKYYFIKSNIKNFAIDENTFLFFPASSSESIIGLSDITENKSLWKMLIAECLGTLILVYVGCGSCIALGDPSTYIQIALTFGLTVATLAQVSQNIFFGYGLWYLKVLN